MIATGKTQPLLATKIVPPRCAPGLIDRPRLLDLVAQIETKQVTVIKAGPGFGKTSLAVAWAERLQKSGKSVAWLALDADDDEPTRFLFYVSHALRCTSGGVGETAIDFISDISLVPFNTIVSTWINDLADIDDDVYLFLDNYHWITDQDIYNAISYLLRYAPTQFHLVLLQPANPPSLWGGYALTISCSRSTPRLCALTWKRHIDFSSRRILADWIRPE